MRIVKGIFELLGLISIVVVGIYCYKTYINPTNSIMTVETNDIQGKIQEIGELATAEYVYTITDTAEKTGNWIFSSSKVVFSYDGVIKAGIEFGEVKITVSDIEKKIYVEMPETKILSHELKNDSLVIYDEKYAVFNKYTFEDMNSSQASAKKKAEETAIENGLLSSAKKNAEDMIRRFIGTLYSDEIYEIEFF